MVQDLVCFLGGGGGGGGGLTGFGFGVWEVGLSKLSSLFNPC